MLIKNKTGMHLKCGAVRVRPWRTAVVPEGTKVNESEFEVLGKKTESKKSKKENE